MQQSECRPTMRVRARLDNRGLGKLWLNGLDISNHCTAFEFRAVPGQPPVISVTLENIELELDGEGLPVIRASSEPST